jgi:hypothetical protein
MITVWDNQGRLCQEGIDYIVTGKAVQIINQAITRIEYTEDPQKPNRAQRRKRKG